MSSQDAKMIFLDALDALLPVPLHRWVVAQGMDLSSYAVRSLLVADLEALLARAPAAMVEFELGRSQEGDRAADLELAKAVLVRAMAKELDPDDEPDPGGGRPGGGARRGKLSILVMQVWTWHLLAKRRGSSSGSAYHATRDGMPVGEASHMDRTAVEDAMGFVLSRTREWMTSLRASLGQIEDVPRDRQAPLFLRSIRVAVFKTLGHQDASFRVVVDRALREICTELDLPWILSVDGQFVVEDSEGSKVLSWSAQPREAQGILASGPRFPHTIGGALYLRGYGAGVYYKTSAMTTSVFVAGGEQARLPWADVISVTFPDGGYATVRERFRQGLVTCRWEPETVTVVVARDGVPGSVFVLKVKGGQSLAAAGDLRIGSPEGCKVDGVVVPAGTWQTADLEKMKSVSIEGTDIYFARRAAFRRALRPVWRRGRLVPEFYVESILTEENAPALRYVDLERRAQGAYLQEVQMTEGGATKLKPEAIGALIEHLVRFGPIRRADAHRYLREHRAFQPLRSAVQHPECASGTDYIPGADRAPVDRRDHGIPKDLDRLLALFQAALGPLPLGIKPTALRERLYKEPIFHQLVDVLDEDAEADFPQRLGLKLAERMIESLDRQGREGRTDQGS